ncbi:MAG: glycosyltransferase family 4 protein [Cyanothece sp. SIO1E1]|nr:glycosyltransferase family 4 protein [Cyanothece sp. SIO1E1]
MKSLERLHLQKDIDDLRVLIVAEHASLKFGGEAALPLHYFRVLRKRGIEAWLIVHERTREELKSIFQADFDRIHFISDTSLHRIVWQHSKLLPKRLSYFTFGLILRLMTQATQRGLAKQIAHDQQIDVIHQPIPVSPKEPSMIFDMGVPVVIGPMNGGMKYPPAFKDMQNRWVELSLGLGYLFSNFFNTLIPGKHRATILLTANQRTTDALPQGTRGKIIELVENGVDLSVWRPEFYSSNPNPENFVQKGLAQCAKKELQKPTKFVFIGRLVDWKAVDLLLIAFKHASEQLSIELEIIGDGPERKGLEEKARELGLAQFKSCTQEEVPGQDSAHATQVREQIHFAGWLSQADCAQRMLRADALILPSILECGGAVVLEAMTMSIPVIATNWGGPADYLDESCGILVEPTSPDSFIDNLADAIIKMAQQPKLRQVMGKAGRSRALNNFDWELKVDAILQIYQEAIKIYKIEQEMLNGQLSKVN